MTFLPNTDVSEESHSRCAVDCAGARLYAYPRGLATVMRIAGEIDAANADLVAREIRRFAQSKTPLILDLSHLDFLAVAGLRALLVLNHEHLQARLYCSVVPGPAMRSLLRIISDHGLTVADSVPEALQLIDDVVQARRHFLSGLSRQRKAPYHAPLTRAAGDYS